MKNTFLGLILFVGLALVFNSCKNDLNIAAPKEEIAVVYAMLDANDPAAPSVVQKNYFKIYRAFLDGERDVYEVAQEADSIYYNSLVAKLTNIQNGNEITLNRETIANLEDGIFPSSPNVVYTTTQNISEFTKYRLTITLPNGKTVKAETKTLGNSNILPLGLNNSVNFFVPSSAQNTNVTLANISPYDTSARLYNLAIRFRFNEIFSDGTENPVMVEWNPLNNVAIRIGEPAISLKLDNGMEFFNNIANKVEPKDGVIQRKFNASGCIELVFTTTGKEFNTYRLVNIANSGLNSNQIFEPYTNIEGGRGIFTGRNVQLKQSVGLSVNSINELMTGSRTGHLLFRGI